MGPHCQRAIGTCALFIDSTISMDIFVISSLLSYFYYFHSYSFSISLRLLFSLLLLFDFSLLQAKPTKLDLRPPLPGGDVCNLPPNPRRSSSHLSAGAPPHLLPDHPPPQFGEIPRRPPSDRSPNRSIGSDSEIGVSRSMRFLLRTRPEASSCSPADRR